VAKAAYDIRGLKEQARAREKALKLRAKLAKMRVKVSELEHKALRLRQKIKEHEEEADLLDQDLVPPPPP